MKSEIQKDRPLWFIFGGGGGSGIARHMADSNVCKSKQLQGEAH